MRPSGGVMTTKILLLLALVAILSGRAAQAEEETIPTTVEKGAETIKEGGKDIGEGFKGIGRGVRDVFTGESSKENFREGKKIGTGIVDVGRGVGGVGRGAGRDVKEGFEGGEDDTETPKTPSDLKEETLEE